MGNPELVAALDLVIAEVESQRREQIAGFMAAHGESSLSTIEDAVDDADLRWMSDLIDHLMILRKKVTGETS
jgi:hypothetical protein